MRNEKVIDLRAAQSREALRRHRKTVRGKIERLRGVSRAAKSCLTDGEGQLSHDGAILVGELFALKSNPRGGFHDNARRQDFDAGIEFAARTLLAMIDVDDERLKILQAQLERINDE